MQTLMDFCRTRPWFSGLLGAALFEAGTCLFRFGLGLQSTRDTAALAPLTAGVRIHHGYFGLLCLGLLLITKQDSRFRPWLIVAGMMFFVSDLVHHGLILPLFTGSPEFDLFYR